jgi:hypothetical protein
LRVELYKLDMLRRQDLTAMTDALREYDIMNAGIDEVGEVDDDDLDEEELLALE